MAPSNKTGLHPTNEVYSFYHQVVVLNVLNKFSPSEEEKKKFLPIFISHPPLSGMALKGETTSKSQPAKMGTSRRPGHKDRHGRVQLRGAAPHNKPPE